jgi:cytochrome c oxidase subunit II
MTTTLIVLASVILLIVVAVQIGKISELSAKIRGEAAAKRDSNNFNAAFGVWFVIAFLVFCVATAWYYKNYMLGYGPLQSASLHGPSIQKLFDVTVFFTAIVFFLTQIALFWFGYKYREQEGRNVLFIPHDNKLEIIWTGIPAVVMCGLVVFGLVVWNDVMADVKENEDFMEIEATAYQFGWTLRYPGADNVLATKYFRNIVPGTNDLGVDFNDPKSHDDIIMSGSEEIVLAKGKKIRVRITSKDVLHNFYLPHFQVKMDAIPGLPTYWVLTPTKTTEEYRQELKKFKEYQVPANAEEPNGPKKWEVFNYELACAELCGTGHFSMRRVVKIVSPEEYQKWAAQQKAFFPDNIEGKVKPGLYTWYSAQAPKEVSTLPTVPLKAVQPIEFSSEAVATAKEGEVLNLKHVNFATGKAVLTPESTKELDIVVEAMTKNANMTVEVGGHTDNAGDAIKNKALSESRAKAVVAYVSGKGIDVKRLMAVGYGPSNPIADNSTTEGKSANRRTEFKIIKK